MRKQKAAGHVSSQLSSFITTMNMTQYRSYENCSRYALLTHFFKSSFLCTSFARAKHPSSRSEQQQPLALSTNNEVLRHRHSPPGHTTSRRSHQSSTSTPSQIQITTQMSLCGKLAYQGCRSGCSRIGY